MVQSCKLPFVLLVNFFIVNDRSKRICVRLFVSWTHKIMKVRYSHGLCNKTHSRERGCDDDR